MPFENNTGLNVTNQYGPRFATGTRGNVLTDGIKNEFVIDGVDVGLQYLFPRGDGIWVYNIDKVTFAVGTVTSIKIGGVEVINATPTAPVRLFKENTGQIVVVGLTSGKVIVEYKNVAGDKDNVLPAFPPYKDQIVTSVSATPATASIATGQTVQISATALPSTAPQQFAYFSSDVTKATVNAQGVVSWVAAGGPTTITIRAANDYTKFATVAITTT